jgi:hypothetical protein
MTANTRKNRQRRNKTLKQQRKRIWDDDPSTSVWGKNKPLEKFWRRLASNTVVVVIFTNGKHKYVKLPNPNTKKSTTLFNEFDANTDIVAVLSSNLSQDAYEIHLYPKAKDHSVGHVIKNYKKYFQSMGAPSKYRLEGTPLMEKVMVPS